MGVSSSKNTHTMENDDTNSRKNSSTKFENTNMSFHKEDEKKRIDEAILKKVLWKE